MSKIFVADKLKIQGTKTLSTIALILILTTISVLMTFPAADAQKTITTHAGIMVAPNPIGVGQQMVVDMWLVEIDPLTNINNTERWNNLSISVTKPDGSRLTLGPFILDDASNRATYYTPDQIGNYTFTVNFLGQLISGTPVLAGTTVPKGLTINNYYGPSNATTTLVVQQAPIVALPQNPLPTGYWQRPINWQNQYWYALSGNWFAINNWMTPSNYNPDTAAVKSAHILWTRPVNGPIAFGGQIGGSTYSNTDNSNYYGGKSYQTAFAPPVIINGVLFYNSPLSVAPKYGTYAVDLRTGQTIWFSNDTGQPTAQTYGSAIVLQGGASYVGSYTPGINYGEVYSHHNPNEVGGLAYLWGISGTTWSMYDATTGNWILNVANSAGGTAIQSPDEEILVYTLNAAGGWLAMWNSTLCVGYNAYQTNPWFWRPPTGLTLQWSNGIQWNVTIPTYVAPDAETGINVTESISAINNGVILATTSSGIFFPQDYQIEVGYNATTGKFLWVQNRTVAEPGQTAQGLMGPVANGIYVEFNKATRQFYGFSIITGEKLWGPTTPLPNPLATYTSAYTVTDSGNIFVANGLQSIYAISFASGALVWTWTSPPAGLQTGWPNYPIEGAGIISAGGIVYVPTGNSHGDQLFKGAQLYAINASNGNQLWGIDAFVESSMAAADGKLVMFNGYDNQIYGFGPGQTATTISASPEISIHGNNVLIQGTVTDQSPGQTCLGIPAAGTPAVSDASMSEWMEYLYMRNCRNQSLQTQPALK